MLRASIRQGTGSISFAFIVLSFPDRSFEIYKLSSTPFQMRPRVGNTPGGSNQGAFMNAATSRGNLGVGVRRPSDGTGQGEHELFYPGSAA
jgi:hypothetical protein